MKESAQMVVIFRIYVKFGARYTYPYLFRPKSDLVREEPMSGLPGLDQILDKNVSGLEFPPDYQIRISGLDSEYLRLRRFSDGSGVDGTRRR